MALPGFTAEASVGPTAQLYRMQGRYGITEVADVYPQLNGGEWDEGLEEEGLDEEESSEMLAGEDADLDDEA